jgi:hypothetical protein
MEDITLTTTTDTMEKFTQTAEQMSRSAQQSGRILNGYLVESQQINIEFTRTATEMWMELFRRQTELDQRMVQTLYGEAEGQTDAFQGITQEWVKLYTAPFFNPFSYSPSAFFREGTQMATRNVEWMTNTARRASAAGGAAMNGGFPISGYDEMNVSEISARLNDLSAAELEQVREYEKRNKNRETLIDQIDRKRRATS